jgi:hypothetical protein
MASLYTHFQAVSGSPKPIHIDSLFTSNRPGSSYTSNTSELLQQLIEQVNTQASVVSGLVGAISGKSSGSSALETVLGGTAFGGSALGGIASAAQSGFSWQSILKDVFPVGGLISGIAGLFDSAPTPPLEQYDAPPSLNFNAVLNSNGTLSQGATNQYGYTRGTSQGLDLTDAEGGPYSPYQRASNGSLLPVAGDPTTRYSGMLNLPEMLQPLVQIAPYSAAPSTNTASSAATPIAAVPTAAGLSSTGTGPTADTTGQAPSFDQQWFNDHGSLIASAVRAQMLNYHPIVDTINDL